MQHPQHALQSRLSAAASSVLARNSLSRNPHSLSSTMLLNGIPSASDMNLAQFANTSSNNLSVLQAPPLHKSDSSVSMASYASASALAANQRIQQLHAQSQMQAQMQLANQAAAAASSTSTGQPLDYNMSQTNLHLPYNSSFLQNLDGSMADSSTNLLALTQGPSTMNLSMLLANSGGSSGNLLLANDSSANANSSFHNLMLPTAATTRMRTSISSNSLTQHTEAELSEDSPYEIITNNQPSVSNMQRSVPPPHSMPRPMQQQSSNLSLLASSSSPVPAPAAGASTISLLNAQQRSMMPSSSLLSIVAQIRRVPSTETLGFNATSANAPAMQTERSAPQYPPFRQIQRPSGPGAANHASSPGTGSRGAFTNGVAADQSTGILQSSTSQPHSRSNSTSFAPLQHPSQPMTLAQHQLYAMMRSPPTANASLNDSRRSSASRGATANAIPPLNAQSLSAQRSGTMSHQSHTMPQSQSQSQLSNANQSMNSLPLSFQQQTPSSNDMSRLYNPSVSSNAQTPLAPAIPQSATSNSMLLPNAIGFSGNFNNSAASQLSAMLQRPNSLTNVAQLGLPPPLGQDSQSLPAVGSTSLLPHSPRTLQQPTSASSSRRSSGANTINNATIAANETLQVQLRPLTPSQTNLASMHSAVSPQRNVSAPQQPGVLHNAPVSTFAFQSQSMPHSPAHTHMQPVMRISASAMPMSSSQLQSHYQYQQQQHQHPITLTHSADGFMPHRTSITVSAPTPLAVPASTGSLSMQRAMPMPLQLGLNMTHESDVASSILAQKQLMAMDTDRIPVLQAQPSSSAAMRQSLSAAGGHSHSQKRASFSMPHHHQPMMAAQMQPFTSMQTQPAANAAATSSLSSSAPASVAAPAV